jgi:hypothetical protein
MKHRAEDIRTERTPSPPRITRLAALIAVLCTLGLLNVASAPAANYETVDTFGGIAKSPAEPGKFPEEVQLGGLGGMAINRSGAGGVAPGTLYTVGFSGGTGGLGLHIARYSPIGTFDLAWTGTSGPCGPATEPPASPTCSAQPTGIGGGSDIEVHQPTGNVYVFVGTSGTGVGKNTVRVYTPDGSKLLTEFAPAAPFGENDTVSPEKVHSSPSGQNIAVNDAGEVFIVDEDNPGDFHHRLMVFKPQTPADYEHYVYAGKANDIGAGFIPSHNPPYRPVTDDEGDIYVAGDDYVEKYDPTQPAAPICEFELKGGGLAAMTVNPANGEVFYYNEKSKDRKIHRLEPCNAEGKFVETQPPFLAVPQREPITAMAFNPTLVCAQPPFEAPVCAAERDPGVLYAGTDRGVSGDKDEDTALGYIFAQVLTKPPVIEKQSVSAIAASSATLRALINPMGTQTSYVFQYLTEAAYQANEPSERFAGATEVPLGGAVLGAAAEGLPAAASITGLVPGGEYRYRAIATSANGSDVGEARAFRTFPVEIAGLPDGRAYELVSPARKNGGEVLPRSAEGASCGAECKPGLAAERFPTQVTADGDAIVYQGQPFGFDEGVTEYNEYLSRRSDAGWQTVGLAPPVVGSVIYQPFAFDPSLTHGLLNAVNPALTPEAPPDYENLVAQPTDDRFSLDALLREAPPNRPAKGGESFDLKYAGASADLSRVFFAANDALTEETATAPEAEDGGVKGFNLYEWHDGQLSLVNVMQGNAATSAGAVFGSGRQVTNPAKQAEDLSHAISSDGSRAFWSDDATGQVYVRIGGTETREIDDPGHFLSASADGSKALLDDGCLYDVDAEECADLTEGQGGFQGLVGQSEDLSHVYFVDTKVLDAEPNDQGAVAQAGKDNLYAWNEGEISFVATLTSNDDDSWEASPVNRSAEASPDGRWLAFGSKGRLTGVNSDGACSYDPNTERYVGEVACEEVFLYDSDNGTLSCPSCNPVGAQPLGGSFLARAGNARGHLEQLRYLTDQGRLYFDSRDSLSGLDTNNQVEDVYQYEPQGVGSCAKAEGCVSLISTGRGSSDSNFLMADPTGANVFFTTRERLVLADKDGAIDLYDAREGGGIPAESETSSGECQGEACQPPPVVPANPTPASSFSGAGNLKAGGERRCRNGKRKARRKGKVRCEPKGRAKQRKRRHHKRAHRRARNHDNHRGAK